MANRYDLGAARAARSEARGEAPVLEIDGREYRLIPEIPWSAIDEAVESTDEDGRTRLGVKLLRTVFGDQWQTFLDREDPSAADIEGLTSWLFEAYGLGVSPDAAKSNGASADPLADSSPASGSISER